MKFRGRDATRIENEQIQLTVLTEGGHIAEITHKTSNLNPLWIPPWPSIEPSGYIPSVHPGYGEDSESRLLAGIMGHNLCIDIFGPPSKEEAAAGLTVHGEASVVRYDVVATGAGLIASANLPIAGLAVTRKIELGADGESIAISETLENLSAADRPIAWTQHVTLGPPFLVPGATKFSLSATNSRTIDDAGFDASNPFKSGAEFVWPNAPTRDGGVYDQRTFTSAPKSSKFTTHLMDPQREDAYFAAWHPSSKLLFGYRWRRSDFPWLGIWEEKCARNSPPWNGNTTAVGMEFGASPFPETRRQMIDRGRLFDTPAYTWIPAKSRRNVQYSVFVRLAEGMPTDL